MIVFCLLIIGIVGVGNVGFVVVIVFVCYGYDVYVFEKYL